MFYSSDQNEMQKVIDGIASGLHFHFCDKCLINHASRYDKIWLPRFEKNAPATWERTIVFYCDECPMDIKGYSREAGH